MKTIRNLIIFFVVVFIIMVSIMIKAYASPFLSCDPQVGVTHYRIEGISWAPTGLIAAQPDTKIRFDLSVANIGNNAIQVRACKVDALWGEVCSTATPFSFPRPDQSTNAPDGLGLVP